MRRFDEVRDEFRDINRCAEELVPTVLYYARRVAWVCVGVLAAVGLLGALLR